MIKNIFFQVIVFLSILFGAPSLLIAVENYQIAPVPHWVKMIPLDYLSQTLSKDTTNEAYCLLVDKQTKVEQKAITYFSHLVKKVLKKEDIQEASTIEIEFNPLHDEVILHQIEVHRGNQTFNQLLPRNIKVLQREEKLEQHLYSGIKSLFIILEDVREGDIIEYKISIKDKDLIASNNFFYNIYPHQSVLARQKSERILFPKGRDIAINYHLTDIKPIINHIGDDVEYTWNLENQPLLTVEDNVPDWYTVVPYIEIREKKSWQDIASSTLNSYTPPQIISDELQKYIRNTENLHKDPADQFIAVMRFIQDDIRYTGIADSEIDLPADPSLTFQRRFGDCKDKTILAITILNKLGVEAYPALVNTNKRKALPKLLPSLYAFNHAIVIAYIHGKQYWIDPTQTFQRGSLENLAQPDYGYALIINSKATNLTQMPSPHLKAPIQEIYETFDLSQGHQSPGILSIKSVYRASSADERRGHYSTKSAKEIQELFLDYYKQFYPSIRIHKEPNIIDDSIKNQLTILEEYEIETPWIFDESEKTWYISYWANELSSYFDATNITQRKTPLFTTHPVNFFKQITLLLPEKDWSNIIKKREVIKDKAFLYKMHTKYEISTYKENKKDLKNVYTVSHEFKSLKDHINPKDIASYIDHAAQAKELLGESIYDYVQQEGIQNPKDYPNWLAILAATLATFLFIFISYKVYHYQPNPKPASVIDSEYVGLGGWLILPIIGIILGAFYRIYEITEYSNLIFSFNTWLALSDPTQAEFHPFKAIAILLGMVITIGLFIFNMLLLIFIFKKKKTTPIFYISFVWVLFLWLIVDSIIAFLLFSQPFSLTESHEIIRLAFSNIVWSIYFFESKRVKATFIN